MKFLALLAALTLASAAPAQAKPMFDFVDSSHLTGAPLKSDFIQGNPKAPVKLIEYASLSCTHCATFHKKVLPELAKKYIDTGKMLYILRPFPLNDPALKAALLIDCVGEEHGNDRYYTFAKVLFDAQNKWAFDATWLNSLETFAKVGGVNHSMFERCITDASREIRLLNVKRAAADELGVNHTPYFFINAHRYDDEATVEKMSAYIDDLLAKQEAEKPAKAKSKVKPAAQP